MKKNYIIGLTLALTITSSSAVFANSYKTDSNPTNGSSNRIQINYSQINKPRNENLEKKKIIEHSNVLEYIQTKLKLTDDQMVEIGSNKGDLHKYLLKNGYTEEDITELIKEAKLHCIDEALENKEITEEEATKIKERITNGKRKNQH
ncbi:MAG: hypothetical protein ACERKV_10750 [Clostridiaceae bacterium]